MAGGCVQVRRSTVRRTVRRLCRGTSAVTRRRCFTPKSDTWKFLTRPP